MSNDLFDAPFNLAGEPIDNSVGKEGEARARAQAEAEAKKAQGQLNYSVQSPFGPARQEGETLADYIKRH